MSITLYYFPHSGPPSDRIVRELTWRGYTVLNDRLTAGDPEQNPAKMKRARMKRMLEANVVVYGPTIMDTELLDLVAACRIAGIRLVGLHVLPGAPEDMAVLDKLDVTKLINGPLSITPKKDEAKPAHP